MPNDTNSQTSNVPAAAAVNNQDAVPILHSYRQAFEQALPASRALDPKKLIPINIDLPTAITTTVGKLPGILALRDRAKALVEFDVSAFDQLETYTLATGHAHARYRSASAPPEAILELNERGMRLRNTLYSDAVALARRKLISGDRIGEFKANIGYKNLAFDLLAFANLLRDNWHQISSKTAITPDELDQAELIGEQLVSAVGGRDQPPANVADITDQRQRNFTLFLNAYDEVRRAISFLRWKEDDAERIAPSLYSGRGNSNARKKRADTPTGTDHPVEKAPSEPAPGAPTTAIAPTDATHSTGLGALNTAFTAPGLPGSSPFIK